MCIHYQHCKLKRQQKNKDGYKLPTLQTEKAAKEQGCVYTTNTANWKSNKRTRMCIHYQHWKLKRQQKNKDGYKLPTLQTEKAAKEQGCVYTTNIANWKAAKEQGCVYTTNIANWKSSKRTRMCIHYQHCKLKSNKRTRMCIHYQHCKLKNKSRHITNVDKAKNISYLWLNDPTRVQTALLLRFIDQRHTQLGTHIHPVGLLWTSDQLVAEAATYTTHNKHKWKTSIPSSEFEPAIPKNEWPRTQALDSTTPGIGQN